jgi:4-carboxymuconolactone decarboxylase
MQREVFSGSDADPREGRISLPTVDALTPEQRKVHQDVVNGPRGRVVGPLRAVIHSPELAARWSRMGEFLRYQTTIPARYSELAIIVTSRRWSSHCEWAIHTRIARAEGVAEETIEAIRTGKPPAFENQDDADIYEFARQLQQTGNVDLSTYRRIGERWGEIGLVELTALIGYYTMVAMTLNAHLVPVPEDETSTLNAHDGNGLHVLPPAIHVARD